MRFSIIVPTWNNLKYLKICLDSIKKNSKYEHDLNVHVNEGIDGSVEYLTNNSIKFNFRCSKEVFELIKSKL